nr:MAG TPA_asm: hypothetical protein [Caudoviricetes sp.]DAV04297.1 MAG TPA: hypothetical protein [Caudoviricetes sp.]
MFVNRQVHHRNIYLGCLDADCPILIFFTIPIVINYRH